MVKEYNLSFLGIVVFAILFLAIGFGLLLAHSELTDPTMSRTEANVLATSKAIEARGTEAAVNSAIRAEAEQHVQTAVAAQAVQEVVAANATATAEMSAAIARATREPLELAALAAQEKATAEASYLQATQSAIEAEQHMNAFNAEATKTAATQEIESHQNAETHKTVTNIALIIGGFIVLGTAVYILTAHTRNQEKAFKLQQMREEQKLTIARIRATEIEIRRQALLLPSRPPQSSTNGSQQHSTRTHSGNRHGSGSRNGHVHNQRNGHPK
ncbi:MAG: hypothetical protein WAM60_03630, partial [Candidatus Promineifilaceae bacterium]